MSILDSLVGGLMGGGAQGSASPLAGVLTSLLEGGQQGGMTGMQGGLGGLMGQFEQAGLGHLMQSWIGNGPNQPVSPQQLQSALGPDQVQGMSGQAGMQPNDFLTMLSQHLPHAVNAMTPNGQLPDGTLSV